MNCNQVAENQVVIYCKLILVSPLFVDCLDSCTCIYMEMAWCPWILAGNELNLVFKNVELCLCRFGIKLLNNPNLDFKNCCRRTVPISETVSHMFLVVYDLHLIEPLIFYRLGLQLAILNLVCISHSLFRQETTQISCAAWRSICLRGQSSPTGSSRPWENTSQSNPQTWKQRFLPSKNSRLQQSSCLNKT